MLVGKAGKAENLTSQRVTELVPKLAVLSFGELLTWLLYEWGARPQGHRDGWELKHFAFAVGYKGADETGRTVRNWLKDRNFPSDSLRIEAALFGDNSIYDPWRNLLRQALAAAHHKHRAPRPKSRAPSRLGKPFVGIPPRLVSFTGRDAELAALHAALASDGSAAASQAITRAAITGMPGVGKTALATEYAHRFRDSYAGIWWCPAETLDALQVALADLAKWAAIAPNKGKYLVDDAKAALHWLGMPRRKKWLLIYNNVPDPRAIADFLPPAGPSILITSRFPNWTGWASSHIPLDVWPPDQAEAYLQARAPDQDPLAARLLARRLGCLPLALDHAAAICQGSQLSFAAFARAVVKLISHAPRSAHYPQTVSATFDLALAEAAARCPEAGTLMAFMTCCAPQRIPLYLIEDAFEDDLTRTQALNSLVDLSLLKFAPLPHGKPAVIVHRLVQTVAQLRFGASQMETDAIARLYASLSRLYPEKGGVLMETNRYPECRLLTPHLLSIMEKVSPDAPPGLFVCAAMFLLAQTAPKEPLPPDLTRFIDAATSASQQALLSSNEDTASTFEELAELLSWRGNLDIALVCSERALFIRERLFGSDHPSFNLHLGMHADLLLQMGNFAEAQSFIERQLAFCEGAFGHHHTSTAKALAQLAYIFEIQGHNPSARQKYQRAISIFLDLGEEKLALLLLTPLAKLYLLEGSVRRATECYERAIEIHRNVTFVGQSETYLAVTAIDLSEEAFPLLDKIFLDTEEAERIRNLLVNVIRAQLDLTALKEICEFRLKGYKSAQGAQHPRTLAAQATFARLESMMSRAFPC